MLSTHEASALGHGLHVGQVVSEQENTRTEELHMNELNTNALGSSAMNTTEMNSNELAASEISPNESELISHEFGVVPPADYDLFDTHFDIDSAMQASFADATQGFWEGFPGNVEVSGW